MQRSADLALAHAIADTPPIEVMLEGMRYHYRRFKDLEATPEIDETQQEELNSELTQAVEMATRAAPYCHPRLNAIAAQIAPSTDPSDTGNVREIAMIMMHVVREAQEEGKPVDLGAMLEGAE